jgi:hypothetical protein
LSCAVLGEMDMRRERKEMEKEDCVEMDGRGVLTR